MPGLLVCWTFNTGLCSFQVLEAALPDVVYKYMSLIDAIVDLACTRQHMTPSDGSDQSKQERDVNMCEMARIILQHPMFVYWFQNTSQQTTKVAKIMTGYVLKLLSKLHNLLTEAGLESIIRQYASKTIVHLNTAVDCYYAMVSVKGEDEATNSSKDSAAELQVSIGQGNFKVGICCGGHLAVTYGGELLYLQIFL